MTVEPDETFTLTLSTPSNPKILQLSPTTTTATGTIINDDFRLNDTGITWAGKALNSRSNSCNTTGNIEGKQDCHHGRDSNKTLNNNADDGFAGFSFTKLDAKGDPYDEDSNITYACVKDNVTGLTWEVKNDKAKDTDIHSNKNTYRWGGLTAQGIDRPNTAYKKGTYYDDWDTLVKGSIANAQSGFRDWRVPSFAELLSIAHLGKAEIPSIDTDYFPHTQSKTYWSSSPTVSSANTTARILYFRRATSFSSARKDFYYVRLVRGRK
jgi:hypothetical protein